ncbi:MAG: hypothetical protein U1F43_27300 [Myxococcota bacterium]
MFENHRQPQRPAVIEIAAVVLAGALVVFSLVAMIVSIDHAGDVVRATRGAVTPPAAEAAAGPVYVQFMPPVAAGSASAADPAAPEHSQIGNGQPSEPNIDLDVPVVCPDPIRSGKTSGSVDVDAGAGSGPVAPCDRDR